MVWSGGISYPTHPCLELNSDWPPVLQVMDFHFMKLCAFFFLPLLCWRVSLVVNSLKPFHWGCEYMNLWLWRKFCQICQHWMVQQSPVSRFRHVVASLYPSHICSFYFEWLIYLFIFWLPSIFFSVMWPRVGSK